jgi:RHS repeat-associated protein
MTTSGPADLNIAHQGSGHVAPGPPSPSGGPAPTPSGQWIPAPYLYISRSQTLHKSTGSGARTEFDGHRGCVLDSYMDIDEPANLPAKPGEKQPTGADLSNQAIIGVAQISSATGKAYSTAKMFAVTGNAVKLCVPGENAGSVHLANGVLVEAGSPGMTFDKMNEKAATVTQNGDPVDVVSGEVIDELVELYLPGGFDVVLKRLYASGRADEAGPFGLGGFTHNYHQWIEEDAAKERTIVRHEDGRDLTFPLIACRDASFRRQKRLTLSRGVDEYTLYDHDTRLTREFAPQSPGGRAMLRAVRDAWNNRVELLYDHGRLARIADTAKREIRFLHDDRGRIVRLEVWAPERFENHQPGPLALQQATEYAYSEDGDLARVTDALGHEQRYAYDGRHRLIEKRLKNGLRFFYTYDPDKNRCVRSVGDGNLQNLELLFDDKKRTSKAVGTPEPRLYIHDEQGLVVSEQTLDGTAERTITVDQDQLVLTHENAGGDLTTWQYDALGNTTKVVRPDGTEVTWEYKDDLLVKRVDPGERVTECTWDHRGGLQRWVQPSGRWHSYDNDNFGRIIAVYDALGVVTSFVFDDQHNVIRETDARGATTSYAYDPMGRMVKKTDSLGRSHAFAYDALGRPVREELPDGTVLESAWDAMGNVLRSSDGHAADVAEYGGTGMIAKRILPDGTSWQFGYDILERLREIKNPKGETHRYHYDRAGRVIEERTFDGEVTRYQYSRHNLLARIEYMDETWLELEYDPLGRRIAEKTPHGTRTYVRNEIGWIVEAVVEEYHGAVTTKVEYDQDGRILSRSVDGKTVAYTYTPTGFLASRTLPNGETTRYHFDLQGALIGLDHEGEKVLLQRDILGREVRRHAYASGVDMWMDYSPDDRLTRLVVTASAERTGERPLVQRGWRYGRHARLAALSDARWGQREFTHDPLGRLTSVQRGREAEFFDYDATGSLQGISRLGEEGGEAWPLRMGNLLLRSDDARFEYDDRRRRRRKIHLKNGAPTGEVTEYVWDCRSQLREVGLPSGERVHFLYDAFGRRVRKVIVGAPRAESPFTLPPMRFVEYVWDHNEVAMIVDSERGATVVVTEPRTFFPIFHREQGETFLCVTDHLGMPTELIDARGRLACSIDHSVWGKVTNAFHDESPPPSRTRPIEVPYRLLGQVHDAETGLASTLYRYFDADTARWLSPDPIGLRGGSNLFAFDGSPTERVDPLGLFTAAAFQKFLNKTNAARIAANNAAINAQRGGNPNGPNKLGPATAGAAQPYPIPPGQPAAPIISQNSGNGPPGHAERDPLRDQQGQSTSDANSSTIQSGSGAVGAGRPHCGLCTQAIINTPGAVPASSIRGATTDRDGNPTGNVGYSIPDPAPGTTPGFKP